MMQNKPLTATQAMHRYEEQQRSKQRLNRAYSSFFSRWFGTKYASEQREALFHIVHALRSSSTGEYGTWKHFFFDRDLKIQGPYNDEETAYATWLLYMETQYEGT